MSGADTFGILGSILDNPELIRSVLGAFNRGKGNKDNSDNTVAEHTTYRRCGPDEHSALLCAMKPYLSKKRCDAVDALIAVIGLIGAVR